MIKNLVDNNRADIELSVVKVENVRRRSWDAQLVTPLSLSSLALALEKPFTWPQPAVLNS
jgi:hypothetical protein